MKVNSFVYFIQDTITENVKIGFTRSNPIKRLKVLQQQTPHLLKLVGAIPGTSKTETGLHSVYSAFKIKGEWFSKDVLSYFDSHPSLSLTGLHHDHLLPKKKAVTTKIQIYFKDNLRWLFKEKVLSKEARKMGLRVSLFHDWVSGARTPSAKNMANVKIICNYLSISLDDLFFKDFSKEINSSVV